MTERTPTRQTEQMTCYGQHQGCYICEDHLAWQRWNEQEWRKNSEPQIQQSRKEESCEGQHLGCWGCTAYAVARDGPPNAYEDRRPGEARSPSRRPNHATVGNMEPYPYQPRAETTDQVTYRNSSGAALENQNPDGQPLLSLPQSAVQIMLAIQRFTGNPSSARSLGDFRREITSSADLIIPPDYPNKNSLLAIITKQRLGGRALDFVNRLEKRKRNDYHLLISALREVFESPSTSATVLTDLETLKQGKMSVMELREAVVKLVSRYIKYSDQENDSPTPDGDQHGGWRDRLCLMYMKSALNKTVHDHLVRKDKLGSFEEMCREAAKIERVEQMIATRDNRTYKMADKSVRKIMNVNADEEADSSANESRQNEKEEEKKDNNERGRGRGIGRGRSRGPNPWRPRGRGNGGEGGNYQNYAQGAYNQSGQGNRGRGSANINAMSPNFPQGQYFPPPQNGNTFNGGPNQNFQNRPNSFFPPGNGNFNGNGNGGNGPPNFQNGPHNFPPQMGNNQNGYRNNASSR